MGAVVRRDVMAKSECPLRTKGVDGVKQTNTKKVSDIIQKNPNPNAW